MKSSKTSQKTSKVTDTAATQTKAAIPDSKPVKRTTKSSAAAKPSNPTTTSHRHSKLNAPAVQEAAMHAASSTEEIASLAHAFWVERNYAHGFAEEDWFRAETVILHKR